MADYKTNDPKGWGGDPSRGAAMGRGACHADDKKKPVKLTLRKVALHQGYDSNGTYFGQPMWDHIRNRWDCGLLYWYADESGEIDNCIRAQNRADAKRVVRETYPQARFYN